MPDSPPPETLAWLRHAASCGQRDAQLTLHLLERVGDLAAAQLEQADSTHFCVNALANRLEALEARDKQDASCWASVRTSMHRLRERIEALEAAQQQQFLAELNTPLTEADRVDLGLPSAELEHDDGINQPTPEAAPVATDQELFAVAELERFPIHAYRACYNLGRQHGAAQPPAAQPASPVAPAWGLVERVSNVLGHYGDGTARDVIREVAAWLDSNAGLPDDATPREADGWEMAAQILNREADR
jgi:hypothetical protein